MSSPKPPIETDDHGFLKLCAICEQPGTVPEPPGWLCEPCSHGAYPDEVCLIAAAHYEQARNDPRKREFAAAAKWYWAKR